MDLSLLLAAFQPEIAGLGDAPPVGWRVALTGAGGVPAAAATARLLAVAKPKKVLFVGTCGAYGGALGVGDCIAAVEAIAISVAEIRRRAYRPAIEDTRWPATWDLPLPKCRLAAPPAITLDLEDAALLGEVADAENLEVAGVLAACAAAHVPAAAALAVANRVGPSAHEEWTANHEDASLGLLGALARLGVLPGGGDAPGRADAKLRYSNSPRY
jgi:purine-nucleoside phosphorylase